MRHIIRSAFPAFPLKHLDKNPVTKGGSRPGRSGGAPVVFSAQGSFAPGVNGVLNAQTLQSGFRTPYFIDEIRIGMKTTALDPDTAGYFEALTDAFRIRFQTGSHAFSNDFVPVGLMAPYFSSVDYGWVETEAAAPLMQAYASVRWILPRPLYMPAGDVVLANVELNDRTGLLATLFGTEVAASITVTYVGRVVAQGFVENEPRCVPWLAWWTKGSDTSFAESQTRLRNPFLVPAHVQRFTSRTYFNANTPRYFEVPRLFQFPGALAHHEVRIDDSRGYAIVSKFAPIGSVFDAARHAWTFGRELTPREQFNMQMRTTGTLPENGTFYTNIGLVGYREESL